MSILFVIVVALFAVIVLFVGVFLLKSILKSKDLAVAYKHIEEKNYSKALVILKRLVEANAEHYEGHKLMGDMYRELKNPKMAIVEYRWAIKGAGKITIHMENTVHYQLAALLSEEGQLKEALNERLLLTKVDDGTYSDNLYHIGILCKQLKEFDKAMKYFTQATGEPKTSEQAHYQLGLLEYEQKKYTEAINAFTNSLRYNKENHEYMYYIGLCYRHVNNHTMALRFLDQAHSIRDLKANVYLNKGICHLQLNRKEAAIDNFNTSLSVNKKRDIVYLYANYYLGLIYEDDGKIMKAIGCWEKINEVNSTFKDVPHKLKNYQDIRTSDELKDFLTCKQAEYQKMCEEIINYYKFKVVKAEIVSNNECSYIVRDGVNKLSLVRDGAISHKLFIFNRVDRSVGDEVFRTLVDEAKQKHCAEIYYFTMGKVTTSAHNFIANRHIQLFTGANLNTILVDLHKR